MPRDTEMRAHGRRTYSFAQHGNTEMGSNLGKHLIRDNRADVWTPCYGDGMTVIRMFPQPAAGAPGQWEPYRIGAGHNEFGDWIRRYPAVRSMGDPSVTFITNDPSDPSIPDARMTPGWVLFNAIDGAVARGQDRPGWAALLRGGRNKGAQLPRPSEVYLVQCAVMHHKTRSYTPPKPFDNPQGRPIIMELGPSAGLALLAELNRTREGYTGGGGNWEEIMAVGDPIAINAGKFVSFYKLADGDPRQQRNPQAAGWTAAPAAWQQSGGRSQQEAVGYGCFVEDMCGQWPASMEVAQDRVRALVAPWDDILEFPTIEEQAHLLADKFPADVVQYAFADYPEWIPEQVRRRAVSAVSVPGSAVPPGPGTAMGMGGAGPMGTQMPVGAPPVAGWGAMNVPQQAMPPQTMPPQAPPPVVPQAPLPAAQGAWTAPAAQPVAPAAVAPAQPTIPASMAWASMPNPVAATPPPPVSSVDPALSAAVAPNALPMGAPSGQPTSAAALALQMAQQLAGRS